MGASVRAVKTARRVARPHVPAVPPTPRRLSPLIAIARDAREASGRRLASASALAVVLAAGIGSAVLYGLLVWAFPLVSLYAHPHVGKNPSAINDMGAITHYSPLAAAAFVLAVLALFTLQFVAVMVGGRREDAVTPGVRRVALAVPMVCSAILIWMQPVTTTDLYGYVARGYLFTYQHLNPMTNPAFLLPGDLLVSRPAAPYGPAWLLLCAAFAALANQNLLVNLLLFKVVGALGVCVSVVLVWALARKLYPQRATRIIVFFGWSPLLLFEAVGNGHNDIVMMVCVLAALVLMRHRYARTAFALLVLGALIKYVAIIMIPFWLVYELGQRQSDHAAGGARTSLGSARARPTGGSVGMVARHARLGEGVPAPRSARSVPRTTRSDGRAALIDARAALTNSALAAMRAIGYVDRRAATELIAGAAAIGGLLVVGCYAPFWEGLKTFSGLEQQVRPLYYNGSLAQFIATPLELFVPPSHYAALDKTVRLVFYAAFGGYAAIQTHRLWLRGPSATMRDVITAGAKVTFAALLLISFWYQPWYVVWLLPLAALANGPFVRRQAVLLSVGSLLTYAVSSFLFVHETGLGQALFVQVFEVLVTFLPLLLLRFGPTERGWPGIARAYAESFRDAFARRPYLFDRAMLVLILVVAALLRLLQLGNPFLTLPSGGTGGSAVQQVGGDLQLVLTDPRGLDAPFVLLQRAMVTIFGATPFAFLLPAAIIGSITVALIYLLNVAVLADGPPARARAVGLLAALLAATSQWHVSLSRSGVQVVLLPLLMCAALYCLLLALRVPASDGAALSARGRPARRTRVRARVIAVRASARAALERKRMLLFAACGVATGLASDLASGLWLLPVLVIGLLVLARWQQPRRYRGTREGLGALALCSIVAGLPGAWRYYIGPYFGFPVGSGVLARSSVPPGTGPTSPLDYVSQVGRNAIGVLRILTAQDYTAGWAGPSGTPVVPVALFPFFYLGVLLVLLWWRRLSSLTLLLLLALPLIVSIAVGSQSSALQAASVLPALCMLPALALYEAARWLGRLPAALDRAHGGKLFVGPEQIGRLLLLAFLVVTTLRTFYWYFQATLPNAPLNSTIAS